MTPIKITITGYDSKLVDKVISQLVEDVLRTGARLAGPIPLPNKRSVFCLLRGPHIDARSKEHVQLIRHKRLLVLNDYNAKTIDALTKMQAPSGVGIEIK